MSLIPPQTADTINTASTVYSAARAAWNIYAKLTAENQSESRAQALAQNAANGWRPDDWSTVYAMTDANGTVYVFDAVLRVEHTSSRRKTEHPVQTGANIVDHSFQLPDHVSFEIGMSDIMDSFTSGQWKDFSTKSISAFQKLKEIQASGLPVTIMTKLNQYDNMLIESIHTVEDASTVNGLKCVVHLGQIMTASVATFTVPDSLRTDAVQVTQGAVQSTDPPGSVLNSGLTFFGVQ